MRFVLLCLLAPALFACGSEDVVDAPKSESAAPAGTGDPPRGEEPPPPAAGLTTDLDDPATDALCYARSRALPDGSFTASDFFPIAGALEVTARVDGARLLLDFRWPDELDATGGTRTDWGSTLSLEGAGALEPGTPTKLPLWDEGVAARSCSAEAIARRPGARRLLASDAEVTIGGRDDRWVYGTVKVGAGELAFHARVATSPLADETTCCLKVRPVLYVPGPKLTDAEVKALCAVRDAKPPVGRLDPDPEFPFGSGAIDVTVHETPHPFRHSLRVQLHYPHTKGKLEDGSPSESTSWFDWYFSERSDDPMPARFVPGRYEDANAFAASGGQTCSRESGGGGSGTIQISKLALVVEKREGDRIEGAIELPDETGTVRRLRFATVVNPSYGVPLCCLD
ncbi:MAG: hypothetical protein KIT84_36360 [Labilithrix sp.]|nr:hypothetical protein [Labilithrix sp.]MCW5816529.1 hypothetical protein [Labilithrix sp.]